MSITDVKLSLLLAPLARVSQPHRNRSSIDKHSSPAPPLPNFPCSFIKFFIVTIGKQKTLVAVGCSFVTRTQKEIKFSWTALVSTTGSLYTRQMRSLPVAGCGERGQPRTLHIGDLQPRAYHAGVERKQIPGVAYQRKLFPPRHSIAPSRRPFSQTQSVVTAAVRKEANFYSCSPSSDGVLVITSNKELNSD